MAFLRIGTVKVTACAADERPSFGNYVRVSVARGINVPEVPGWPARIAELDDSVNQPAAAVEKAIDAAEVLVDRAIAQGVNVVFCCRQGKVRSATVACGVFKRFHGTQREVDRFLRHTNKMNSRNFSVETVFRPIVASVMGSPKAKR